MFSLLGGEQIEAAMKRLAHDLDRDVQFLADGMLQDYTVWWWKLHTLLEWNCCEEDSGHDDDTFTPYSPDQLHELENVINNAPNGSLGYMPNNIRVSL